ncbi:hypothetical protein LPJ53_004540 [Coemansia erecta]|uniref:Uncharacterized protein n=1 Tax=Coemansia erecta TaxID=147472 RepID=A0A9W8CR83_9FUNG|nr:hypothetical protein LPJ53_004540 [Coemansia erecta]
MMLLRALVRTPAARRGLRRPAAHTLAQPPPTPTHLQTRLQPRLQPRPIGLQTRAYTDGTASPPVQPAAGMRQQALASLTACIDAGDMLGTYRVAHAMRSSSLLLDSQGRATPHVLQDALVAGHLTRAISGHHEWEESASLVDLLVEMRPVGLNRQPLDARFVRTGRVVPGVGRETVGRLAAAVLSPQYAALPERRLAGLTAQQLLADYSVDPDRRRVLSIRAEGFASRGRALRRLLATLGELRGAERVEAGVAHARCMDAPEASALLAGACSLDTPGGREAHVALALCVAESGDAQAALLMAEQVAGEEGLRLRLWIARAGALAVVPRRPLSQPFHTLASAHRSRTFAAGLAGHVARAFEETARLVGAAEEGVRRRLDKLLFSAECAVHAMQRSTRAACARPEQPAASGDAGESAHLPRRLGALQGALAAQMAAQGVTRDSACAAALAHAFGSAPLRQLLWAQQFDAALTLRPARKQRQMLAHVDRTCAELPGYAPSAADLWPALVACLPPGVWTQEARGAFRDDAAFEAADGFLAARARAVVDEAARNLLAKAQAVLRDGRLGRAGHVRLHALCVWLLLAHGDVAGALRAARRALRAAPVALEEGALALRHVRTPALFAMLLPALAQARPTADFALAHVLPLLPRTLSPRLAAAVLRCCATARNASVALDVLARLPAGEARRPAKVRELLLRALLRGGRVTAALQEFRSLCYDTRGAAPGDATFAALVGHMAGARASVRGAEHAFDAWFKVAAHQGRVGRALAEHYGAVGVTRDARATLARSPFAPASGASPGEALAALGEPAAAPQRYASARFLRMSELRVVVALVAGYVRAGLLERARLWEQWIVAALAAGRLAARPEVVACLAVVQRRHVARRAAEDVRACVDLLVAVDGAAGGRLMERPSLLINQGGVVRALGDLAREDPRMRAVLVDHLAQARATHLLRHIVGLDG